MIKYKIIIDVESDEEKDKVIELLKENKIKCWIDIYKQE